MILPVSQGLIIAEAETCAICLCPNRKRSKTLNNLNGQSTPRDDNICFLDYKALVIEVRLVSFLQAV
jgi:hypothetical protein